ncbi:Rieske 2Fe-2S domain-containing protein [Nocardioides sp.]|uniref:Rieske 2Fe-2S domain-containing protein n=1 Tax=Nocardioides sp. TaxID=35761 RepID=UPI002722CA8E|nr:Rieske 2Fe-2S domain-containing protein [Nocardioides sp.]MDO9457952.1 Rieske 2Fe-2S domain-containing protein [Nocardioides sp.]
MTTPRSTTPLTRRRALAGVTGVGLALPILAACGDDGDAGTATDSSTSGSTAPTSSSAPTTDPTSEPTSDAASETSAPPETVDGVVSTADVPVGSGVILGGEQLVVTQATEGDIKVFSSICTHQGCPVTGITDVISCTCHGSTFDLATGDVLGGPAPSPLPAVDFTVEGDQVVLS